VHGLPPGVSGGHDDPHRDQQVAGIIIITIITIVTLIIIILVIRYGLYVCTMLLLHKPCMSSYPRAFIGAIFATQSYLNTACVGAAVPFTATCCARMLKACMRAFSQSLSFVCLEMTVSAQLTSASPFASCSCLSTCRMLPFAGESGRLPRPSVPTR